MRLSSLDPLVRDLVHRILTSTGKSTSRNVQKHWQGGTLPVNGSDGWGPDGQIKTVFGLPATDQKLGLVGGVDSGSVGELLHAGIG